MRLCHCFMRTPGIIRGRRATQGVWAACVSLAACFGISLASWVAPAQAQEAAGKQHIVVLTRGALPEPSEASFVANLRAHLSELKLSLGAQELPISAGLPETVAEARRQTETANAFLVVWIMRDGGSRTVYMYDPVGPHLRARSVTLSGSSAAASEELALILRSEILARLQGGEVPMPEVALPKATALVPEAPTAMVEEASPIHPTSPRWGVGPAGIYDQPVRDQHGQFGLGLRAFAGGHRFRGGLAYTFFPAFEVSAPEATISLRRHPIEGFAGYDMWNTRVHSLVAEVGFLLDPIQRRTESVQAPLSSLGANWRWSAAATARLRSELRVLRNLAVNLGVGVEALVNPYDFEVEVATERRVVARLAPFRWTLELGMTILAW